MDNPIDFLTDRIFNHPDFNMADYELGILTGQWSSIFEYADHLEEVAAARREKLGYCAN